MMDYKGGGNLLYLPLDKLMQQGAAQFADPAAARPTAPEPAPAPDVAPRSRESLRDRERGERP
jgi:membrane protease subunit HflK